MLDRDIADMHAIPRAEFMRLAWADPAKGEIDYTQLPDTELAGIARGREALALFGWKPYMHNPRLKRWLHRIDHPDAADLGRAGRHRHHGYGEAWHAEIPGARMDVIAERRPLPALGTAGRIRRRASPPSPTATEETSMRSWYFSEMAYHPAWEEGLKRGSLRVILPNENLDPPNAHGCCNRYLDEFALCDEVGLDIMVNEHHSTATCMTVSVPMALADHRPRNQEARGC